MTLRILPFVLAVQLALPLARAAQTNETVALKPGPNDGRIASQTAELLHEVHYLHSRLPLDAAFSSRFMDMYVNALDPQHAVFLQGDLAEFEPYRANLAGLALQSNTAPAYLIFNRFMQRQTERTDYVNELLKTNDFEFTSDEKVLLNRKALPFPTNIDEAHQIWRDRVRYEYLSEKLNHETPEGAANDVVRPNSAIDLGLIWGGRRDEITTVIKRRYSRVLRSYRELGSEEVLQTYLTAMANVFDPHSDYMDKSSLDNFSIQMSLSLFGVGATLTSEDGFCRIQSLQPNGPAAKSGKLKPDDRIVAVAQGTNAPVDVVDMSLTKVVEQIRGPKGTEVRLTIIPAHAPEATREVVSIVRDEIRLEDQQAKASLIELPDNKGGTMRLGVIDLPSFYATFPVATATDQPEVKSTTVDVARLIGELQKQDVKGIILDLRRNGGGSLEEAINLTGLFIKGGPVVQVRDWQNHVNIDSSDNTAPFYDGPLIVLTSRFSASASEIVAGALQDYGRAVLVGDKSTHGKGTVQSLLQLAATLSAAERARLANENALGALKLTIRKFYRPSGSSTQLKGVVPDIHLPSVDDDLDMIGEDSLNNPLAWDTIDPAKFDKLNRVQPFIRDLNKDSALRVASSKDFDYVREDIAELVKLEADKSVSLNEDTQLSEREQAEAQHRKREGEMKARKMPDEKIFDVTLKKGVPVITDEKTNLTANGTTTWDGTYDIPSKTSEITTNDFPDVGRRQPANINIASGNTTAVTNSAAVAKTGTAQPKDDEDKAPVVDTDLNEAEQILIDYIGLLAKDHTLALHSDSADK